MNLEDVEQVLRNRLDALGPYPRAELLRVLMLPDYGNSKTRTFAELLIDLEESPYARAVVLGELRERELRGGS